MNGFSDSLLPLQRKQLSLSLLSQVRQALGEDLRSVYTLLVIAGFTLPALVAFGVSQGIRGMAGIFGRKKQAHAVQKEKYMSKIR